MADFEIKGLYGFRDPTVDDVYTVSVVVKREPHSIICNTVVAMQVSTLLSAFSFFLDDYGSALGAVLTALLTAVSFKLQLADQLPNTPTLSPIER